MEQSDRDNPDRFPRASANHVADVRWKRMQIATPISFRSHTAAIRSEGCADPSVDRIHDLGAKSPSEAGLLGFVIGNRLSELPLGLAEDDEPHRPSLPINLCHYLRKWAALRDPSIDALNPALDLVLPGSLYLQISGCLTPLQKGARKSQLAPGAAAPTPALA